MLRTRLGVPVLLVASLLAAGAGRTQPATARDNSTARQPQTAPQIQPAPANPTSPGVVGAQPSDSTPTLTHRIFSRLRSVFTFLNSGIFGSIIFAWLVVRWKRNQDRFDERRTARTPRKTHLWNLIGEPTDDSDRVIALLSAINRGAIERAKQRSDPMIPIDRRRRIPAILRGKIHESPEKASRIWNPSAGELFAAANVFVTAGAAISDGGPPQGGDGLEKVKAWLKECHGRDTPAATGRIFVRSAGGTGKTIFLHRLLLDLTHDFSGAASAPDRPPVPMLARAENVKDNAPRIAQLQTTTDTLSTFVEVWLDVRGILIPEKDKRSLIDDFKDALRDGQIVLLFDGDDELREAGLKDFVDNLLGQVRYWVTTHQSDANEPVKAERIVSLDESWDAKTIMSYIDARWAAAAPELRDSPDFAAKREMVKRVIDGVLSRHRESGKRAPVTTEPDDVAGIARVTHPEPHWLSQPRNLEFYLSLIEDKKIQDESEMRKSAESQPRVFGKLIEAAIHRIHAEGDVDTIRHNLFDIAVNDPTDIRRRSVDPEDWRIMMVDESVARQLQRMGELVGFSPRKKQFYIKDSALREYFIAGQIAHELLDPFHALAPGDELTRNDSWTGTTREAVISWLRDPRNSDPLPAVTSRLQRRKPTERRLTPAMRRNLLDILITLRIPRDTKRAGAEAFSDLDLSGIAGHQLDIHLLKFERCDFSNALLNDAYLTYATFKLCEFKNANLSDADAIAAVFHDCTFGADGFAPANVTGLAIDRAEFKIGGTPALLQRKLLIDRHASLERSRYRGEFGKKFFAAQKAFLGPGVERLERDHYLRAIEEAICAWMKKDLTSPIYLVDLMAGGSYDRIADLRKKFDRLHILGIDRDSSAKPVDSRFGWAQFEIGKRSTSDQRALGFDISSSLEKYFGAGAAPAHIIVAKKAFHEIDRDKQQLLIHECARALHAGGRLILFEDTPGLLDGEVAPNLSKTLSELETLRHKLGEDVDDVRRDVAAEPDDVVRALAGLHYGTSAAELIGFANTWIMVKDWANLNRHEVRNRYFASVPEIKQWASGVFGAPRETKSDHYRLNPLIFNELGIQRVLDHLTREGGNSLQVVDRDEAHLSEWIWDSERLKVLVDFTRKNLAPGEPLPKAVDAKEESIDLTQIDPELALLNRSDITAPTFNLPCTVLVFEKS